MTDNHQSQRKHLVVLTGAGISAESGLKTFRDSGGLWENYDVMEVASIQGWRRNPELVLKFYNERRRQAWSAQPNAGHRELARLEHWFSVDVITQNVDRLHERAGSTRVVHLHGDLHRARCVEVESCTVELRDKPIKWGDLSEHGHQLRPDIVWFGEMVPAMDIAVELVQKAHAFLVVGTSLNVYPAAGLLEWVPFGVPIWVVDPNADELRFRGRVLHAIAESAGTGVAKAGKDILDFFGFETQNL